MKSKILVQMLKTMLKIRKFEEKVVEIFRTGVMPGWVHSYIGEEAVATGVYLNLNR